MALEKQRRFWTYFLIIAVILIIAYFAVIQFTGQVISENPQEILGCMDSEAENYSPTATLDDGSCEYIAGCRDTDALNYNPKAILDGGGCEYAPEEETRTIKYFVGGGSSGGSGSGGGYAPEESGNSQEIFGCTNSSAENYNPSANTDDGSCEYSLNCLLGDVNLDGEINIVDPVELVGYILGNVNFNENQLCAADYNEDGIIDEYDLNDLLSELGFEDAMGCTNSSAENYNPNAIIDDGSCEYIPNLFKYNSSESQAFYFFMNVTIDGESITSDDWIGAFNGNISVGSVQWAGAGTEVPVMGNNYDGFTEGYMETGEYPTFMIYDFSEDVYYEAIPSENIPWIVEGMPIIDSLTAVTN